MPCKAMAHSKQVAFFSIQIFINWSRCWSFLYANDPFLAKGCDEYRLLNSSNSWFILDLLVCTFHPLNTVEKGVLYISHILSRNITEVGNCEDIMSIRESWTRESS